MLQETLDALLAQIEEIRGGAYQEQDAAKDYEQTYADGWMDACNAILDVVFALKK